jgi:hypothetical protein
MRTGKRLTQVTVALGAGILAMTATPSFGKGDPALTVRNVTVHGTQVAITVTNRTAHTQAGTVSSRVLINGVPTTLSTPVTAQAGETVKVDIVLPSPAGDLTPAGVVVDDGVPF